MTEIKVELLDTMGSDLTVVNAARVSFDKQSEWDAEVGEDDEGSYVTPTLQEKDQKLITFLADHEHTSPFRHCFAQFRVKAPIFVARQLMKHQVGLAWNEVSRRYVDSAPEFYVPETWRKRSKDKKQGSSNIPAFESGTEWHNYTYLLTVAQELYRHAIEDMKICPEQARMVLPQSAFTEWYWSGSLQAFAHMCNLRCKEDAQYETRLVANLIDEELAEVFPYAWKALRNA